ncbi:hypothetical protein Pse7367_2145 [Thalassoporum mexicanum PCC 7367]|uniref:hypothetical protein n=1 Tax=Thalassoporum mexicanum TaxID=3457544 RepID=UPI00029FD3F6|nr:hypothetical protein [Pseudanabaena sp. PCC 7367]AFY70409.1 hypothetical protein Pse7367_2145 [Pseudanabaena sp. PCC 7367]
MPGTTELTPNNPAAQIHNILVQILKYSEGSMAMNALGAAMAVKPTHSLPAFENIINDFESSVFVLNGMKRRYCDQAVAMLKAFVEGVNQGATISSVRPFLHDELFSLLIKSSSYIQGHGFYLESSTLEELQKDIDEWLERITNSNLDDKISDFLYSSLDGLSRAIRDYRFAGNKGLSDSVELSFGKYFVVIDNEAKQQNKELWKDFFEFLGKVLTALRVVDISSKLLEKAPDILKLPHSNN